MKRRIALVIGLAALAACSRASGPCPVDAAVKGAGPPNGRLLFCQRDGRNEGPWLEWYVDGRPKTRGSFRAGREQGHWIAWNVRGEVISEGDYDGGAKTGTWVESMSDSGGRRIAEYRERGSEVRYTLYRKNGTRWAIGRMRWQKRDGHYTEFHPNGEKAAEGEFRDGNRIGEWRYWDESGQPTLSPQGTLALTQ